MGVSVIKPGVNEIDQMCRNIRSVDLKEIRATTEDPLRKAINKKISQSERVFCAIKHAKVLAIYGIVKQSELNGVRRGEVWMICTTDVEKYPMQLCKKAKQFLATAFKTGYDKLTNHVHIENETAIAWLQWLGAEVGEPCVYGRDTYHKKFREFSFVRK